MKKLIAAAAALGLLLSLGCGEDSSKKGLNSGKDMPVASTGDTQK